jgi:hypothetical protein
MRALPFLALVFVSSSLLAQPDSVARSADSTASHKHAPPEYSGLVAGVALTNASLSMGDSSLGRKAGLSLHIGVRFCGLCWAGVRDLQVTPLIAFMVTDFGGMNPDYETFGTSHLDVGADLSYRVASRLRVFGTVRTGKRTAEVVEQGKVVNYAGSGGSAFGGGIEIPIIRASGRGIRLGFTSLSGQFDSREYRRVVDTVAVDYSSRVYYVGWSGGFTGIDLPWR